MVLHSNSKTYRVDLAGIVVTIKPQHHNLTITYTIQLQGVKSLVSGLPNY